MSFLDRFAADQRDTLLQAATRNEIARGNYLLRRGDPGGDVFFLESGTFEVVDTKNAAEIILTVMEPGAVMGEIAFVDNSPRTADVRAASDGVVLRWARDDLRALLQHKPALAATFYETVAKFAAERLRASNSAIRTAPIAQIGSSRAREDAERIAEVTKEAFLLVDQKLRQDPTDTGTQTRLRASLDRLQDEIAQLCTANPDPDAMRSASRILHRELHAWLVRSALAERCLRRSEGGVGGAADVIAHVLVDSAAGDGVFGETVDRWLLDRPSLRAMRGFREPILDQVSTHLPKHRNRRVLVVNSGTGSLVASLAHSVAKKPTVITVLDGSRDALAYLDAGIARPKSVDIATVQESVVGLATGRTRVKMPPQDAIVLQSVVEYLPERLAIAMLTTCATLLSQEGMVLAPALAPTPDEHVFDHLLGWPTVRRSREAMRRIFTGAGLAFEEVPMSPPALLFIGRALAPDKPAT